MQQYNYIEQFLGQSKQLYISYRLGQFVNTEMLRSNPAPKETVTRSPAPKGIETRFMWNTAENIKLCKLVIEDDPAAAPYGQVNRKWDELAQVMEAPCGKSVRQHLDLLLRQRIAEEAAGRRKSGASEEVSHLQQLLSYIIEMRNDQTNREQYSEETREVMRIACSTLSEKKEIDSTPKRKKASHSLNWQKFEELVKERDAQKAQAQKSRDEKLEHYRAQKLKFLEKLANK